MVRETGNKKNETMNKRGSLIDIVYIAVVVFVFGTSLLFGLKIVNEFSTEVSGIADVPAEANTANTALKNHYSGVMDNMTILLLFGFAISTLIMASLVRIHPAFLFIYFILLLIVVVISAVLSNVYSEMSDDPNMTGLTDDLIVTTAVLRYLPLIIAVVGSILAVVMYQGWKNDQ